MSTVERHSGKPKNLTCARCNAHVEAVHAGSGRDAAGRRTERWEHGPCRNPQCPDSHPEQGS